MGLGVVGLGVVGLAFGSGVLTQEGRNGAGLRHLLGEGALHVLDGRVGAGAQQQLHDVGELTRRSCRRKRE